MMLRSLLILTKLTILCSVIGLVVGIGIIYKYSRDLPDYSQLEKYYPPSTTRIYSADGKLIEEYAREKRIFVPIENIPKNLVDAFIAAEDKNFYNHPGIDIFSIIRAAITNIAHIANNRRIEGGSTITQQVVKNFLLTSERSLERKIKEAILSYMVSQVFSKEQILELYLNQIYLGRGTYGVATAALVYFNKSIEELTLNECATMAALPKAPSKFNPKTNYDRAFKRKNYVIKRMYEDDYITKEQAQDTVKMSIILADHSKSETMDAPYYAEQVRGEVIDMFGQEYFYTAGLTIITCLDSKIQQQAENSLVYGIRKHDMKMGYRSAMANIEIMDDWQKALANVKKPISLREYQLSVVLNVEDTTAKIGLENGNTALLYLKNMKWTRTNLNSIHKILKIGDVIVVGKEKGQYRLRQIPQINGGIMVVQPSTGRVLASVGGYDFSVSKFDRTTQAKRQPGSLIKPFVYMAALENGIKPNDLFEDAPIELEQGPGLPMWTPKNYEDDFLGPTTMRKGLEKSRNLITVRVGLAAGLNKVTETIQRFGINDNPPKLNSIVLGSLETTLDKMTIAYSIIANKGRKITPHYIEMIKDRKGNIIYKRSYSECDGCKQIGLDKNDGILPPKLPVDDRHIITDDATSYQITSFMMGGAQRGTSRGTKWLNKIIAGKTGTTNDSKDTWFVGFTPRILVGTYIGYDNPRTLGRRASGATVALPVFVDFMKKAYKTVPSIDFETPESIRLVPIDYETGLPSTEKGAILEAFKVNDYLPWLEQSQQKLQQKSTYNPFDKIQEIDESQELY